MQLHDGAVTRCAVCRKMRRVVLGCVIHDEPAGLDRRVPALPDECRSCGYCAPDITVAEPSDAEAVRGSDYRAIRADATLRTDIQRWLCRAILEDAAGRPLEAAGALLAVADAWDPTGAWSKHAADSRRRAAERLAGLEPGGGVPLRLIDLCRRAGLFDEAARAIAHAERTVPPEPDPPWGREPTDRQILEYQCGLVERRDRAFHTLDEARSHHQDGRVRLFLAEVAPRIEPGSAAVPPILARALGSADGAVRDWALAHQRVFLDAARAGRLGPGEIAAVADALRLPRLGRWGGEILAAARAGVGALLAAVAAGDSSLEPIIREHAVALGQVPANREAARRYAQHGHDAARALALRILESDTGSPEFLELCAQAHDPDPAVRAAAVIGLHRTGSPAAIELVKQALRSDTDWQVRQNAAIRLGLAGGAGVLACLLAARLREQVPSVRLYIETSLGKHRESREVVASLAVRPPSEGRPASLPLRFQASYVIGRAADVDLCLTADARVARRHVHLWVACDGIHVRDLGQANLPLHNGRPVRTCELADRDVLTVGTTEIELRLADAVPDSA